MSIWQLALMGAIAVLLVFFSAGSSGAAAAAEQGPTARAKRFIQQYESAIRPMEIEVNLCWWAANLSGKDEDYRKKQEAETALDLRLADPAAFAELKALHQECLADPLLARQIHLLYLQYLPKQVEPALLAQIVAKSNEVEKAFNVYRPRVNGKEMSDNEVREVLRRSKDSALRQAVWEASKGVGPLVEPGLRHLVKLRNQAARKLGFKNYCTMRLYLGEQSQEQLVKLFDELDALTREPFRAAKAEIDAALAKQYGVAVEQLRPWHYHDPFFQEPPAVLDDDFEAVYAPVDILATCRNFFAGIGLSVDDVLARSDLYEKKGKNPHAFCTDIDREGDVRVLANVVPGRQWLATMLHELGHAVYSKNVSRSLPYALRDAAHPLTTEGVAMMFDRFALSADWLAAMGVAVPEPARFRRATQRLQRHALLVFSRWCQVMFRFEQALYDDPDQDLNKRWWDLVEKYQEVRPPTGRNAPDYASKIHFVSSPVYYHNYMLGEMFASQLHHAIVRKLRLGNDPAKAVYAGNPAAGAFFCQRVFGPGATMNWNDLTRHATGEDLSAKALAADLAWEE